MSENNLSDRETSSHTRVGERDALDPESEFNELLLCLETARRAHDQLPPLTTYRHGWLARFEIWLKRKSKKLTHWYIWEQINFNSALCEALARISRLLYDQEQRLAHLQRIFPLKQRINTHEAADVPRDTAPNKRWEELERAIGERDSRFEMFREESRVHLKQISLEILELHSSISALREQIFKLAQELEELKANSLENLKRQ